MDQKSEHFLALLPTVIDQTQRRVFNVEGVPASQKIVSLFEPHNDIIMKGQCNVQFGHNISELRRAFSASKATLEGHDEFKDGFKAFI